MYNITGRMCRTFVLGDMHGAYRALRQCLERAAFHPETDHLIALGDVADGWPETKACIEHLMSLKNLTYLLGNHDYWALEWMQTGITDALWYEQGGKATVESYAETVPQSHIHFLMQALPFFLKDNRLFVHAGFDPARPIEHQSLQTLIWDRSFARKALDLHSDGQPGKLTRYDEVYLGHTPTMTGEPVHAGEVWLMDTGAGWSGCLTIMNIDTKEIFASDPVPQLYPGIEGRSRR